MADSGAVGVARGTVVAQAVLAIGILVAARASGLAIPWMGIARHVIASGVMAAAISPLTGSFFAIPILVGLFVYPVVLVSICPAASLERQLLGKLMGRLRHRGSQE